MSEELTLLKAMCEALDLKVERDIKITKGDAPRKMQPHYFGTNPFPEWQSYEFIGDGQYVEVKREIVYKVTKINPQG